MAERQQAQDRLKRLQRTTKLTVLALGLGLGALALNAYCNHRVGVEGRESDVLEGYNYKIRPSNLGPNLVRIEALSTGLPLGAPAESMQRGRDRLIRDCEGIQHEELSFEGGAAAEVGYFVVNNRQSSSCFPNP